MVLHEYITFIQTLSFCCNDCGSPLQAKEDKGEVTVELCAVCRKDYEAEAFDKGAAKGDDDGYQRGFNDHSDMCETCRKHTYDLGFAEGRSQQEAN